MVPSPRSPGLPSTGSPELKPMLIHVLADLFQSRGVGELGQSNLSQVSRDAVAEDADDLAPFADRVTG